MVKISKPSRVVGHNLSFTNATVEDAEFILSLRLDAQKSRFLSTTSSELAEQKHWLRTYATDDSQVYFIIKDSEGARIGTVRIYDPVENSFCWGSWIIKAGEPFFCSIESALIVYEFALSLGFTRSHFDVRKQNKSVWQFHEKFGAKRVKETELDYYYEIENKDILRSLARYKKYLPQAIKIIDGNVVSNG